MAQPLNILVADDRPDSVLFLTEFLLSRKHRVATVGNGKEALSAILRRKGGNDPFDLIISEITLPGMDGLALFRDLRRRQEPIELVICTAYASMNPHLKQDADRLNCIGILEKPADLSQLEEVIALASSRKRTTPGTARTEQPFFGTARVVRSADPKTTNTFRREQSQAGEGLERRTDPAPGSASYTRRPSPLPFEETELPPQPRQVQSYSHQAPTTDSIPRPVAIDQRPPAAIPVPQPSGASDRPPVASPSDAPPAAVKPLAPMTTRLRRTITGTERITRSAPPADAATSDNSRPVACALCGKPFMVVVKSATYSVVCVHCGQLNRIDPLT
ncbi:MAG: response regulator [Planctomycetes bacterium]|nr:response regulator [Planctomycetota bacterium]